jgi:beta-glucanase (GH16 family)
MFKKCKFIVFVLMFTLVAAFFPEKQMVSAATWNLVWSDEFSSPLSSANWSYEIGTGSGGWGNNELQYYTNRSQNIQVVNGNLEITALKESYGGMGYTSARIKSKGLKEFKYGKIEARMKLPSGKGIWPAFWMLGSNIDSVSWPRCGEIDIMERVNTEPYVHGTVHWDSNGYASFGRQSGNLDFSQYHTYSIEWDSKYIRWFVDGVQYNEILIENNAGGTEEFQQSFFLLLNLAVGGNWPGSPDGSTPFPAKMFVDYVRVYSDGGSTPPPPPPTANKPYFMLVNKNSGKAADLIGGNTANGARINQWAYDYNAPNQRWSIEPSGNGHFKMISYVSGKALCVAGPSLNDGAQIHAWDYTGVGTDQQWDFIHVGDGWYQIRNVYSGKVLDVSGGSTANDAKIQQWTWNGTGAQLWRLQPWGDYNIKTFAGKYVCVENRGSTNGQRIIQYSYENNPWFKWRFENVGEGWTKVSSLNALGRCIDVADVSYNAGALTHLWDYVGGANQKVRIEPQTDGTFKFYFQHSGQTWDMQGAGTGNNVPVVQWGSSSAPNQRFVLERVQ